MSFTVTVRVRKFTLMCQICESSVTLSGLTGFPAVVMRVLGATGEEKTSEGEGGIRLETISTIQ